MRTPQALAVRLLLFLVVFALMPAVDAQDRAGASGPDLGPGWSLEHEPTGPVLVYTPADPVPLRDARPQFRDGNRLLGYPLERDGRLELALTPVAAAALQSPSAWLSGRRLDGPTPATPIYQEPSVTEPPTARVLTGKDDPGEPGPYATEDFSYELPSLAIDGFPVPVEVIGEVIAPVGAPGLRPLVLFLHGRHDTCYLPEPDSTVVQGGNCPEGMLPIPSYQGYRYVAGLSPPRATSPSPSRPTASATRTAGRPTAGPRLAPPSSVTTLPSGWAGPPEVTTPGVAASWTQ